MLLRRPSASPRRRRVVNIPPHCHTAKPPHRPTATTQAEVVNGRLAMAAITLSVALSADPTLKAIVAVYRAARGGDAV